MEVNEDTIIVWYSIDDLSEELKFAIDGISHDLELCTDQQNLFQIIDSLIIAKNNVLCVISGYCSDIENVLSSINKMKEIVGIFIYDNSDSYKNISLTNYSKLYDIFTDHKVLIKRISKLARILTRQAVIFKYKENESSMYMYDLSNQRGAHTYILDQLDRHDAFRNYETSENKKHTAFDQLRYIYRSSMRQLKKIDEMEDKYKSNDALIWYTKDTVLFKTINKELRNKSCSSASALSKYFIADIYFELKSEWKNNPMAISHVYRGLKLSENGIQWIKSHVGHTISILGFFSTSRSKEVAHMFADNVLIDIEIESTCASIIYADISKFSNFEDEEEVLFDFNSTFKITNVSFNDTENLWSINLVKQFLMMNLYTHLTQVLFRKII